MNPAKFFGDVDRPWTHEWAIPPKPGQAPAPNTDAAAWAEAKTAAKDIEFRDPYPAETASSYMAAVKFARDTPPSKPITERLGLRGLKRMGAP